MFQETGSEMNEDYIIVRGLMPGEMYEFSVVAVDGEHMTESEVEEVEISSMGEFYTVNIEVLLCKVYYINSPQFSDVETIPL